jgi:hypothetical protein
MPARRWFALLLVIAVGGGTFSDSVPARTRTKAGAYWILAGDLHVHAFPGDGALLPWTLRREAQHAGIDVIAVTNHNQTFAARLARWVAAGGDPIVIPGSEITNPGFHISAVGISQAVRWNRPASTIIEEVHAQGGVAIAAHPERRYWASWDERAVAVLDGVEVAHPGRHEDPAVARDFDAFYDRLRHARSHVAAIGSSDFHANPSLGQSRTYVLARDWSEAGVLDAIRAGRTVAEDSNGRLYGDPELLELVEANRPPGRSDQHPLLRRLSVVSAWVALAGMLLCQGRGVRGWQPVVKR